MDLYDHPINKSHSPGEQLSRVLLLSGVYDIREHYKYEAWRAVEDISPMKPAMRGHTYFSQYSPTTILKHAKAVDGSTG